MIDWDKVFDGAEWFHWTGITPALSDSAAALTLEACKAAKAKGITISCDLNYRKKLWTREKAKEVMSELVKYVDVMIANEEDSKDVFGIEAEGTDIETGKLSEAGYRDLAKKLAGAFGAKKVAFTLRESFSANDNNWSALIYDAASDKAVRSRQYAIRIVDRVAIVDGTDRLMSAPVTATDLRAGAALIVAGLIAEGTTEIANAHYIRRGYEKIDEKLRHLGAQVEWYTREVPD